MGPGANVMDVARFGSQKFGENSGTQCLSFYWVFMGNAEVEFNLHSYKGDPLTEGGILFGRVFSLDNSDWRFTQVEITETDAFEVNLNKRIKTNFQFQMVFEAVKVAEGNSSLSLDDITLVASSCPVLGSCDFSKDTCGSQEALVRSWEAIGCSRGSG